MTSSAISTISGSAMKKAIVDLLCMALRRLVRRRAGALASIP